MKANIADLHDEERKLRKKLEDVANQVKAAEDAERNEKLEELKPLAIKAHDALCGWNHTDGCSWQYEVQKNGEHKDWEGKYSSHARWLATVEQWMAHKSFGQPLTVEKLNSILDIIIEGKKVHPDFLRIVREVLNRS